MLDAEHEQVAEAAWVAAGGRGFMQDAVGAQRLGPAGQVQGGKSVIGLRRDHGSVSVFVVAIAAALIVVLGLVIDGGRMLAGHRRTRNLAAQAARAGAQEVVTPTAGGRPMLDQVRAPQRAQSFLVAAGARGSARVVCRAGICDRIEVTVDDTIDMSILGAFGVAHRDVSDTVTVRLATGITSEGG